ncbi:MAG: hypothetical protein PHU43_03430 [Candidatus Bipolaricaulis sp.]|nr:hypothetical protein [Candidatus Bipolaricaulis sp.]
MGIINAELIKSTLKIPPAVSNQSIEDLADATIDIMNSLGADIPNMNGSSGAKTLNVDSKQRGKFWLGIRATYNSLKDMTSKSIGDVSFQPADLLSNDIVMQQLQRAATLAAEPSIRRG